jgi:hypothetical protein
MSAKRYTLWGIAHEYKFYTISKEISTIFWKFLFLLFYVRQNNACYAKLTTFGKRYTFWGIALLVPTNSALPQTPV